MRPEGTPEPPTLPDPVPASGGLSLSCPSILLHSSAPRAGCADIYLGQSLLLIRSKFGVGLSESRLADQMPALQVYRDLFMAVHVLALPYRLQALSMGSCCLSSCHLAIPCSTPAAETLTCTLNCSRPH